MDGWIGWGLAACLVIAFLVFVHRPVQTYIARLWLDTDSAQARLLVASSPDSPFRLRGVGELFWEDEAQRQFRMRYEHNPNVEMSCRITSAEDDPVLLLEGAYFDVRRQAFFDPFFSETQFLAVDGGTEVTTTLTIVRSALLPIRWGRIVLPLSLWFLPRMLQDALARRRAEIGAPPPRKSRELSGLSRLLAPIGGWKPLINLAAILWFLYDLGLWPGLVMLATILFHEGGHWLSMRRHGHHLAKMMLVPFLGGVAYSSEPMADDGADAEMTLMGPAAGLVLALLAYAAGRMAENEWLIVASAFAAVINGFNLAPIPPLDGGRYAQLLLRRFGETIWRFVSLALVVAGIGVSYWLGSTLLMVLFVFYGTALAFARPKVTTRPALTSRQTALSLVAYLVLVGLHLWLIGVTTDWELDPDLWVILVAGLL